MYVTLSSLKEAWYKNVKNNRRKPLSYIIVEVASRYLRNLPNSVLGNLQIGAQVKFGFLPVSWASN